MALSITIYDYYLKYYCKTFNRSGQLLELEFQEKLPVQDIPPNKSQLNLVEFTCEYFNGNEEKYEPVIISQRANIIIRADYNSSSSINPEMFYADQFDKWKLTAKVDNVIVFKGFVTNENTPYIMKDKPYNFAIIATDGLGLLKNIELTNASNDKFTGRSTILSYIQGALAKTNLNLDINVYCNIYHKSHKNRYDVGSPDMMTQTKLHHRTFLKDYSTYIDCYTALEKILKGWAVLYQYKGNWIINNILELQANPGPQRYYSTYSYNGSITNTSFDNDLICTFGKLKKIQPINNDHYISYQFPVKSVKTNFNYEVPDNLFNNQKLQEVGSWISPIGGNEYDYESGELIGTYLGYEKIGWDNYLPQWVINLNNSGYTYLGKYYAYTGNKKSYIKIVTNEYGVEMERYYVIQKDMSTQTYNYGFYIRHTNEDFFVDKGDIVTITIEARYIYKDSHPNNDTTNIGQLLILKDGTDGSSLNDWYNVNANGEWFNNPIGWTFLTQPQDDDRVWQTISVTTKPAPASGVLYFSLGPGVINSSSTNELHVKDINIEYTPRVKGSILNTKGDFWKTSQTVNLKDTIDESIEISDSPKRILKGSFWNNDDTSLLSPEWYRLNETETKHFKELANLGRYRHQYRRQKRVNGTFKGVLWSPDGGSSVQNPLCFHRHYFIENDNKAYVLTAPLSIDYIKSQWKGTLIECGVGSTDYNNSGNSHVFNYNF